jgi:hypothetical protein
MALASYLALTQNLLQNPAAPTNLYDPTLLTLYINQARVWLAGDSQAIKFTGTYNLAIGSQGPYPFSGITLTGATGVQGVLNVRQQWYFVGSGQLWFRSRPWPWFSVYFANSAAPESGPPKAWSQYGEGENGTIFIGPLPDQAYTINADCVCVPIPLVDDNTVEAIPAPWTIAIPYYAAYLALLSSQTGAREQDAEKMMSLYEKFVVGARRQVTSEIMPTNFSQIPSPVRDNQLGVSGGSR